MTQGEHSSLSHFMSFLQALEERGLVRPPHMTLASYFSHLTELSLLSESASSLLLSHYHSLRFARSHGSAVNFEQSVQELEGCLRLVQEASLEQRERWSQAFQMPSEQDTKEPHEEDSAEGLREGEQPRREAESFAQLKPGVGEPEEGGSTPASKTPRPFPKQVEEEVVKVSWGRRFFTRPFWHHLWWLILLGGISSLFFMYQGAKRYDKVMALRYKFQNRVSKSMGFAQVTIPPKYLPGLRRERDETRDAAQRFTRYLLRKNPKNARLWRRLASYYFNHDQYAKAIAFYYGSLSLNPNMPSALNDLAWLFCTADKVEFRDYVRALSLAKRAYALRKTPDIIDTFAEASFLNGQFEQAVKLSKEALSLKPKSEKEYYVRQLRKFQKAWEKKRRTQPTGPRSPSQTNRR